MKQSQTADAILKTIPIPYNRKTKALFINIYSLCLMVGLVLHRDVWHTNAQKRTKHTAPRPPYARSVEAGEAAAEPLATCGVQQAKHVCVLGASEDIDPGFGACTYSRMRVIHINKQIKLTFYIYNHIPGFKF
jgi:hypothetical protein